MSGTVTTDRIAAQVYADLEELTEEHVREAVDAAVSPVTTVLFQMVVDDNAVAFLDYEGEANTPFDVLRSAVIDAIVEKVGQLIEEGG